MRLCFNIDLPDRNLQRVGASQVPADAKLVDWGGCYAPKLRGRVREEMGQGARHHSPLAFPLKSALRPTQVGGQTRGVWAPDLQVISGMGSGLTIEGRSFKGFEGREFNRFFPVLLCLEVLTRINEWHLEYATHGQLPPLYKSGVYYQEEPPGEEEWLDYPSLLAQVWGDCEDIACARTGELRWHLREPAVPAIRFKDFEVSGQIITLIHVLCLRASGTVEDPSRVLGMKGSYNDKD